MKATLDGYFCSGPDGDTWDGYRGDAVRMPMRMYDVLRDGDRIGTSDGRLGKVSLGCVDGKRCAVAGMRGRANLHEWLDSVDRKSVV